MKEPALASGCVIGSSRHINDRGVLVHSGARTQQRLITSHHQHQYAAKIYCQQWHCDRGHKTPYNQGMPFPLPNGVKQAHRMVAKMLDLLLAKRQAACVKQVDTDLNEGHKEEQVKRSHHVGTDLRCDLIKSESPGHHHHSQRRETHRRIDADDYSQRQAPRKTPRCHAAAQLAE
jgi:hypothetical protein